MNADQIRTHVAAALADIAPEADLSGVAPDEPLREALDLDSMDFLRLVQKLHTRLGVDVPEADYGRVRTLAGLVAYLQARARG